MYREGHNRPSYVNLILLVVFHSAEYEYVYVYVYD